MVVTWVHLAALDRIRRRVGHVGSVMHAAVATLEPSVFLKRQHGEAVTPIARDGGRLGHLIRRPSRNASDIMRKAKEQHLHACIMPISAYSDVMGWRVEVLNEAVVAELNAWPVKVRASLDKIVERIETLGLERLHAPHVKHLQGKLWEMRPSAAGDEGRACTLPSLVSVS